MGRVFVVVSIDTGDAKEAALLIHRAIRAHGPSKQRGADVLQVQDHAHRTIWSPMRPSPKLPPGFEASKTEGAAEHG